jgi:SagB-type dehydrogenase family enzyme
MPEAPVSIAQHYHERTKYDPATLAAKSKGIDFSRQPYPFKAYRLGSEIDLKPYLDDGPPAEPAADTLWWRRLSHLLINSYGLTAKMPTAEGDTFYLRAAPSAGGLYPAELYLVSRGTAYLPAGLYNYQARTHSLWRYWDAHLWQELQAACFWHPALEATHLAVVVSAMFFRSAWRYQDRAYRRIFLDSGHLLGNLALAGTATDYRPHLIGGFADEALNRLLYLDPDEEGAIAVLALADLLAVEQNLPHSSSALPALTQTEFSAVPDGQLLSYFHRSTQLAADAELNWPARPAAATLAEDKYNMPFCLKVSTKTAPVYWGEHLQDLEATILKRRSTRRYSGAALALGELKALLDFTYQPQHYVSQGFDGDPDYFDLGLLQTFIAVSGVEGLDEGCYYYAPCSQELRQVRFKNFRRELHYLCLGQDLGRDAAAVLFHTADLKAAIAKYGDRVYRYLHLDAGHLGQRLNLAAVRLGLGASGIGGFFDDQVNEVLGIPVDEAVIYITTLGRPARG